MEHIQPFLVGGMSGSIATLFIQPIDMVKTSIQIQNEKGKVVVKDIVSKIMREEGIRGFYRGLDSAILRQLMYGTARLGLYRQMYNTKMKENQGKGVSFKEKAYCSLVAGFVASLVGNPADLSLVRMQNDVSLPLEQRRNYRHVADAFQTIVREEGALALWKGSSPTIARAMSMNFGMMVSFDTARERLNAMKGTKDQLSTRLQASCIGGFFASLMSLPWDNCKTKMQKQKIDANGQLPFKNLPHCVYKTISTEGVLGLWVGFPVFYCRVAPHAMIALMSMEYLNDFFTGLRKKQQQ